MEIISVVHWGQARKNGRSVGLRPTHTGAGSKAPFFNPSKRHNVIMQGACLLLSLT